MTTATPTPAPCADVPAWHEQAIPHLGQRSDRAIARDLAIPVHWVYQLRQSMGIAALQQSRWGYEELSKLGVEADADLAKRLGVSVSAVSRKRRQVEPPFERRGIPPEAKELLGKITDLEMSKRFGRQYQAVRKWRVDAGLPPVRVRLPWTDAEIAVLGTQTDAQVARKLGRIPQSVTKKREALGIAPHTS